MQATVTAVLTASFPQPAPSSFSRTLYSKEYTTDHKARQESDNFIGMKDYNAPIGLPDQMALYPKVWIPLTFAKQKWLFDCLCLSAYGILPDNMTAQQKKTAIEEWAKFMDGGRCFTNKAGWNNGRADYIQGLNLGADPMEWEPLVLGGNVVEKTGRTENYPTTYLNFGQGSYMHYEIRAIDIDKLSDYPPAEVVKDPCIWHKATTIKPDGTTGVFPQFGEKAGYPILGRDVFIWERLIE